MESPAGVEGATVREPEPQWDCYEGVCYLDLMSHMQCVFIGKDGDLWNLHSEYQN